MCAACADEASLMLGDTFYCSFVRIENGNEDAFYFSLYTRKMFVKSKPLKISLS